MSRRPVNVNPAGPLVVCGDRWGLPGGMRGTLSGPVADQAAVLGVRVALCLPLPPGGVDAPLWALGAEAVPIGTSDSPEPWRYRVTVAGAEPVTVVLVGRDGGQWGGPWSGLSGSEACRALERLGHYLGVPWSHSTSRTAEDLILSTHPRAKGGRTLDRAPRVPGPAAVGTLEQPWTAWQRPLTPVEAGAAWVHTYDANAAFLGCWQTVELGFGTPEHLPTPEACALRTERAGVWRVVLPAGWSDGEGLPPIASGLRPDDDGQPAGWVMTPTLGRLRQWAAETGQGEVVPEEGHAWPERSRFLRAAGERLRDARAAAVAAAAGAEAELADPGALDDWALERVASRLAVAGAVRDAVRDLYTITTGRFATHNEHAAAVWRRPDWTNTIRAEWRVNLHRKLARWSAGGGAAPFAILTDAVAFATDDPDPAAFAARIGLRLGSGLGQWKHQGTAELADVLPHLAGKRRALAGVFDTAATGLGR